MEVQGKKLLGRVLKNSRVMTALTVGTLLAVGSMYVGQVNAAATKGYAVKALEKKGIELRQERDRLKSDIAKLRSLDSVMARQSFLGLQKIEHPVFITEGANVVAVK